MVQPLMPIEAFSTKVNGADVEIFDPPMCCPTGLCGPTLDQTLLDVNEMILTLQSEGVSCGALPDDLPSTGFLEQRRCDATGA